MINSAYKIRRGIEENKVEENGNSFQPCSLRLIHEHVGGFYGSCYPAAIHQVQVVAGICESLRHAILARELSLEEYAQVEC